VKGGGRGWVQMEATHEINVSEYLHTKYKEDQLVNIVKSHEGIQPNTNLTITITAKVAEELNQTNERSDTKKAYNIQKQDHESP
jgi:hypothetical protein